MNALRQEYVDLVSKKRGAEADVVVVEEAGFRDEEGKPCRVFASGSAVQMHLGLRFLARLEHVLIAFAVESDSEKMVFGTNTMRLGARSLSVDEGDRVDLAMGATLNLTPGNYSIRMSILRYHVYEQVASVDLATFVVNEDPRVTGIANLNPELIAFSRDGVSLIEECHPCSQ
jgi:hypothetical protein